VAGKIFARSKFGACADEDVCLQHGRFLRGRFCGTQRAVDKSDQFSGFLKIDPFMKPLRYDPRFPELLKRVGFPN